ALSDPVFFVSDDHDTFENDEHDGKVATMPPDIYGLRGAEQTQHLYYPEFLPDGNRPDWLPGADKAERPVGANMLYLSAPHPAARVTASPAPAERGLRAAPRGPRTSLR